jgi:mRNA interferase MazF
MKTGTIILVPFPFSELTEVKVRPAVVIAVTKDKFKDLVVCAISSVISERLTANEMLLESNSTNNLRVDSVVKVDRIVTIKRESKIADLGKLSAEELKLFKKKFCNLVESNND